MTQSDIGIVEKLLRISEGGNYVMAMKPNLPANPDGPEAAAVIERLHDWMAEIQMNAHQWMVAHDRLKAGKPYDLPKPADLPAIITEMVEALEQIRDCKRSNYDTDRAWALAMQLRANLGLKSWLGK